jgi:hypothetical protein
MKNLNKKAFSVIEYAVLIVIIIGALVVMKTYLQRGLFGTWGQSGQSFAFGRQYDSEKTIECSFDQQSNKWYDRNCYQSVVNQTCNMGDTVCAEGVITGGSCSQSSCNAVSQ